MHKHIIQVSTYQMCVLMLFNKEEMFTCEVSMIDEGHLRENHLSMLFGIYISCHLVSILTAVNFHF